MTWFRDFVDISLFYSFLDDRELIMMIYTVPGESQFATRVSIVGHRAREAHVYLSGSRCHAAQNSTC